MASFSKGKAHYNISSGNIEVDLEASNRVGDYATLTVENRDPNTYESLEEPYMNVSLGQSPNEEKDAKPGERKVRTIMTRSPRKWMYIGVLTAVILLLVIAVGFIVFLLVSSKSEENSEENGSCPQYTDIENGRVVNTTGSKHGDVIEIECEKRNKLVGPNSITCLSSGKWSATPKCERENSEESGRCPNYTDIENGKVVHTTGSKHGDVIEFECDERNKLVGPSLITCLSPGKWSATPKCMPKDCGELVIPDNVIIESKANGSQVGTEISVSCTGGFKLHGKKTTICQLDESWSDIPTCKSFDCGVPGNIANAEVIGLFKRTYNSTFNVKCNEGYQLKGSNIIRCTASGVWDGLPTCEMVSCGVPDIPTRATISDITGTSFQATAIFKCDEGFYMEGNSVIRCQANGLWTKDSTCKGCPSGWKSFKGSCYLFLAEFRGWEDAKVFCESQKAHLLKVDDSEEDDFIRCVISVQQYGSYYWVGGRFDVKYNDFRWTDGTAVAFNGWALDRPRSNFTGCIDYLKHGNPPWRWNNHFDCVDTKGPSICEIN